MTIALDRFHDEDAARIRAAVAMGERNAQMQELFDRLRADGWKQEPAILEVAERLGWSDALVRKMVYRKP